GRSWSDLQSLAGEDEARIRPDRGLVRGIDVGDEFGDLVGAVDESLRDRPQTLSALDLMSGRLVSRGSGFGRLRGGLGLRRNGCGIAVVVRTVGFRGGGRALCWIRLIRLLSRPAGIRQP